MNDCIKVLIGADIAPTSENIELFVEKNVKMLVGNEVLEILKSSDYRIFNLEAPLLNENMPIKKSGPNISAPIETVNGLKALGIDLLTLANNHIRDHGDFGIQSTINALQTKRIEYIGIGDSISQVIKHKIINLKGIKIGIYACTEHEYSIANDEHSGANPFDYIDTFNDISILKKDCDYVIVLYHGGTELYRYPTPQIKKICRHMVNSGADIVLVQHTHCIGAYEVYNSGTIVYGQGNFIFNNSESELTQTSLLVLVEFSCKKDRIPTVHYLPLEKTEFGTKLAEDSKSRQILEGFNSRSSEINDLKLLKKRYSEYSIDKIKEIKYVLGGRFTNNRIFRFLDKCIGGKLLKMTFTEGHLLFIKDLFMCESNSEMLSNNILNDE